jgi:hypothetical protein
MRPGGPDGRSPEGPDPAGAGRRDVAYQLLATAVLPAVRTAGGCSAPRPRRRGPPSCWPRRRVPSRPSRRTSGRGRWCRGPTARPAGSPPRQGPRRPPPSAIVPSRWTTRPGSRRSRTPRRLPPQVRPPSAAGGPPPPSRRRAGGQGRIVPARTRCSRRSWDPGRRCWRRPPACGAREPGVRHPTGRTWPALCTTARLALRRPRASLPGAPPRQPGDPHACYPGSRSRCQTSTEP